MNKICIFGANGQTGVQLIEQAIEQGLRIKAAVRKKESLAQYKDKVEIVEYSFDKIETVQNALLDCDIVISAIGSGSNADAAKATTLYSRAISAILAVMGSSAVNRLIVISSAGVDPDPNAPWYYRYLFRPWLMNSYMDMMKMETIIEESNPNINWTIVRPTYLQDGKSNEYLAIDRMVGKGNYKINRIDVAKFILNECKRSEWIKKYPTLGYS